MPASTAKSPMRNITLVRGARQLLTLHGPAGPRRGADLRNLGLIQDGAVLIVDGKIHEVGPARRVENLSLARDAEEIDASGSVVMPGFVDSNTHLVGGPPRMLDHELRLAGASEEQIAESGGGPMAQARAIQDLSPRTLEILGVRALEEAVRHGTTTLETRSGFGLTEAGEIKLLKVQHALQHRLLTVVSTLFIGRLAPEFEQRPDDYVAWSSSCLLPFVQRHKLADFVAIHCEENSFTAGQARTYLSSARQLGFRVKMHVGRGAPDALRAAVELDAFSADHMLDATEEDALLLAQSDTIATLLPGAAFFGGGERYAPARMLIDAGTAVALASNFNSETGPSQNMQMILAIACRSMKMTPAEAITAATLNAAYAVGLGDQLGSLEAGKSADLLILRVPDYREISYHFGINLMDRVIKRGVMLAERSEVKWPPH